MRVRVQVVAVLLYVFSAISAAASFPGVFGSHMGPRANTLGRAQVLDAQGDLLLGTRGVLLQAHATFLAEDGKPIDVAKLALNYRPLKTGDAVTCVIRAPSTDCHALPLSDEMNWRLANWVGLGGRRAFTLLSEDTPGLAKLVAAVLADGLVLTGDREGEYVAAVFNTPPLLRLLRHVDYSPMFASYDSDDDLVSRTNAQFGYPAALDEQPVGIPIDRSYLNTDLDADFSMTLGATSSLNGVPARYHWTAFKDKKYAYLRAIRHARSIEDFRNAAEQEWLIESPTDKVHADAVDMFRTVAVFRTFAFGNPEAFMKYLEQVSKKHTLILE